SWSSSLSRRRCWCRCWRSRASARRTRRSSARSCATRACAPACCSTFTRRCSSRASASACSSRRTSCSIVTWRFDVIRFAYGLMVLLIVCAAGPLRADEAANTAAAKRLFASGTKHFDLNEFELALADFKEGYRLKDDPVFLYNIAQCHRLLNHDVEAMRFYKSYLRRSPNAPNKREVENKIRALDEAIASQEK